MMVLNVVMFSLGIIVGAFIMGGVVPTLLDILSKEPLSNTLTTYQLLNEKTGEVGVVTYDTLEEAEKAVLYCKAIQDGATYTIVKG